MFRFIPAFLLASIVSAWADSFVVWPLPQPPAGTPPALFPVPRVELDYFQGHVNDARKRPIDLLFDGDSITDFWQGEGSIVWQQHYGALNAMDFGVGGATTGNLLWRLNHGELDGLHPKLIVLMIGTNNVARDSAEDIAAAIKLATETYRKHCPAAHLLVLGIFPRGASPADPLRAKIKQVNQIISKLDDGRNVTFLDIGDKFLQPDGSLTVDIMHDFVHPTGKGYQIWADAIQPVIDQYCPKSAASPPGAPSPPITSSEPTLSWPLDPPPAGMPLACFPTPQIYWLGMFQYHLEEAKRGPCDIIFDGDESTYLWEGAAGQAVWAAHFGPHRPLDLGTPGDQVQYTLWRVQHGVLASQDPKMIVLMTGANNAGQDPKDVAAGIKLIVQEYEARCPNAHILLLGIFPSGAAAKSPARDWIVQVNQVLATYDDGKRVTYLDIGPKFLQPDGTLSPDVMPDFVHPSAKGYAIWADAIQPVIDQCFPPPAAK